MNRYASKTLAIALAVALVLGLVAALMPATAEAAGPGRRPQYYPHQSMVQQPHHWQGNTGSARWSTPGPPKFIVRDNGDNCDWWGYVRTGQGYKRVRTNCCRYGNATQDYAINPRQVWNNP